MSCRARDWLRPGTIARGPLSLSRAMSGKGRRGTRDSFQPGQHLGPTMGSHLLCWVSARSFTAGMVMSVPNVT